jgi:hypothetical protein
MSYSISTAGNKETVKESINRQCDENKSPEIGEVKAFLTAAVDSIDDDKVIVIDASGSHYSGFASHDIKVRSYQGKA